MERCVKIRPLLPLLLLFILYLPSDLQNMDARRTIRVALWGRSLLRASLMPSITEVRIDACSVDWLNLLAALVKVHCYSLLHYNDQAIFHMLLGMLLFGIFFWT